MVVLPTFIFLASMTAQVSSSSTPNEQKLNLFNRGSKKRSNAAQVSLNLFNNGKKRSSEESLHGSPEQRKMRRLDSSIDSNNEQCTEDNMLLEEFFYGFYPGIKFWKNHCPGFSKKDDIVCDFHDFTSINGKNHDDACSELGGKLLRVKFERHNQDISVFKGDNSEVILYKTFSFKKMQISNSAQCVNPSCNETEVSAYYNNLDSEPHKYEECTSTNALQGDFLSNFEPGLRFWKKYCPGFPKKDNIDCDFNDFTSHDGQNLEKSCNKAGGELLRLDVEGCNVNMDNFIFDKIQINNVPQCVNPSCSEAQAATIFSEQFPNKCRSEGQYDTFALEYNDENTLLTENCKWLQEQSKRKIRRICSAKKFQLYREGMLPASRVCTTTCKRFDCVAESNNAKFLAAAEYDQKSGSEVEEVRSCKQLKKHPRIMKMLCEELPIFGFMNSEYGHAYEVCTSTCNSSCLSGKRD